MTNGESVLLTDEFDFLIFSYGRRFTTALISQCWRQYNVKIYVSW